MAKGGKEVLNRIKSVKNTKKITKAMEMVAQSKMKKAQDKALATKSYSQKAYEILLNLSNVSDLKSSYLFTNKADKKRNLYIIITSDKGLCGGLNSQVIKTLEENLKTKRDVVPGFLPIGKKGMDYVLRMRKDLDTKFNINTDTVTYRDIKPLVKYIFKGFKSGEYDSIFIVYTKFINTLSQKPVLLKLLPFDEEFKNIAKATTGIDLKASTRYEFEPDTDSILEYLITHIIEAQILQACYESAVSEHSSRMMAMKNATENAGDLIDELTLIYNKARQAMITQEISEIVGGVAALN